MPDLGSDCLPLLSVSSQIKKAPGRQSPTPWTRLRGRCGRVQAQFSAPLFLKLLSFILFFYLLFWHKYLSKCLPALHYPPYGGEKATVGGWCRCRHRVESSQAKPSHRCAENSSVQRMRTNPSDRRISFSRSQRRCCSTVHDTSIHTQVVCK